jgi:ATP-dependent Clp protease protease subunit
MIFGNDEQEEELTPEEVAQVMAAMADDEPPLMGLGSDLTESAAQSLAMALLQYNGGKIRATAEDFEDDDEDIEFYISSGGGSVNDMFAVYDLMNIVKIHRDIATFGFGKIYSAAVPLLAAGTKGKRYIGRNARLMMHHCSTAAQGTQPDVRTTFQEMQKVEDMMVQSIADNSSLSVGEIYNMLSKNTDEFFSAQDALEMGIVDEII